MLAQQFTAYDEWRQGLSESLAGFRQWLVDNGTSDAQTEQRLERLREKLREDRLYIAFVAEFSRGKSELINAIFFSHYGNRVLPSTAGRTTMCPTELMYNERKPVGIELLPIETRQTNTSISEYKNQPGEWKTIPLDEDSQEAVQRALGSVSEVWHVSSEEAEKLGFPANGKKFLGITTTEDGLIEIPRWRHAVINYPHPLLKRGLVILDTPGLNAIGAEPELTLSLLPNAHAILFILAADTGVTQSDLAIWTDHIDKQNGSDKGRIAVLNKIDGMWDELKSEREIDAEIDKQVHSCASILGLPTSHIFPVSAQKGLVAKINDDNALLQRSRLPALEEALSDGLIPTKQNIVRENIDSEFSSIYMRTRGSLESRLANLRLQLDELGELRGKNQGVVEYMMGKIRIERDDFDVGLQRFYAVRRIFTQLSNRLFGHLGLDAMRSLTSSTRRVMTNATFSKTLSGAMKNFFHRSRRNMQKSEIDAQEIFEMIDAIQKKFIIEHGLKLNIPDSFSLVPYQRDIDRLEKWCDKHLNTAIHLLVNQKSNVMQRFFDEVARQVKATFERANRDAELWIKSLMTPLEAQIRDYQFQLRRRLESIKRIHQATDSLEEHIKELLSTESYLVSQIYAIESIARDVQHLLNMHLNDERTRDAA